MMYVFIFMILNYTNFAKFMVLTILVATERLYQFSKSFSHNLGSVDTKETFLKDELTQQREDWKRQ